MINQIYLKEKILEEIKKEFKKNKIIKLENFLESGVYKIVDLEARKINLNHVKIPDKFSFSFGKPPEKIKEIFLSGEMKKTIKKLTNKKINKIRIKKFSHKDYTLIHDSSKNSKKIKIFFFICDTWNPDHGGNFVFTKSDRKTFYITPHPNSLCIINKQKEWKDFVQYINHLSQNRQIIVIEIG